jgi:CHAT domain-containing protein
VLWRKAATKEQVMQLAGQRHWLHFSCHGQYRLDAPLESALRLAGEKNLTLGEILEQLHLPQTWLVVLSACETGLVDFREIADEHFGLPTGFLFAGVPTVWGTLWTVDDLSTAVLMVKAYEGLTREGKGKPEAVRDAQRWVRDLTEKELSVLESQMKSAPRRAPMASTAIASSTGMRESHQTPEERPLAHPFFWAGLQCVGA